MGLIAQGYRFIKKQFSKFFSIFDRFRREPEEGVEEVPAKWMKEKERKTGTAIWRPKGKTKVEQKNGKYMIVKPTRKLYRLPWLRQSKRALAGFLLIMNLAIGEFILATTPGAIIFALLFGANSLILIDYLWKTMRRPEQ